MKEDQMLTEERAAQILMEEVVGRRPATPDRDLHQAEYRKGIRRDVRMLKKAGVEVVIPSTQPDPL